MERSIKNYSTEYLILDIMETSQEPIGAGGLYEFLKKQGVIISEAGIGRILRDLRQKYLLERIGFRGHMITDKGRTRIMELRESKKMGEMLRELIPNNNSEFKVINILIARRALEREAAYQAALNATPQDIRRLENIVMAQYAGMEKNESYSDLSTGFHREIINIARAPLLKNLYEFIGLSVKWQDFFIGTFKLYKHPLNTSHEMILNAIKEHDSEKAAKLMGLHLSDVINYAQQLLNSQIKNERI